MKKLKIKKFVQLPSPNHDLGYSDAELKKFMTLEERKKFSKWVDGQTVGIADGLLRYYTHTVISFLNVRRKNGVKYFY